MKYQFTFEKLEVWQQARKLTAEIYTVTKQFPGDEKYSLVSQMRRAALSVCANLSEGTSRNTPKDQAHFTTLAFSSLLELLNHLIIANDLGMITEEKLNSIRDFIKNLSVRLNNLRTAQLNRIK